MDQLLQTTETGAEDSQSAYNPRGLNTLLSGGLSGAGGRDEAQGFSTAGEREGETRFSTGGALAAARNAEAELQGLEKRLRGQLGGAPADSTAGHGFLPQPRRGGGDEDEAGEEGGGGEKVRTAGGASTSSPRGGLGGHLPGGGGRGGAPSDGDRETPQETPIMMSAKAADAELLGFEKRLKKTIDGVESCPRGGSSTPVVGKKVVGQQLVGKKVVKGKVISNEKVVGKSQAVATPVGANTKFDDTTAPKNHDHSLLGAGTEKPAPKNRGKQAAKPARRSSSGETPMPIQYQQAKCDLDTTAPIVRDGVAKKKSSFLDAQANALAALEKLDQAAGAGGVVAAPPPSIAPVAQETVHRKKPRPLVADQLSKIVFKGSAGGGSLNAPVVPQSVGSMHRRDSPAAHTLASHANKISPIHEGRIFSPPTAGNLF